MLIKSRFVEFYFT